MDHDNTALEIAQYHVQVLGWRGIGYHLLVHPDGQVDYVGDLATIRANVAYKNPSVIGVCLPGDFTSHEPPETQIAATRELLAELRRWYPWALVVGHKDIADPRSPTACPGATWPAWRGRIGA